jgi:hypothetical protein
VLHNIISSNYVVLSRLGNYTIAMTHYKQRQLSNLCNTTDHATCSVMLVSIINMVWEWMEGRGGELEGGKRGRGEIS